VDSNGEVAICKRVRRSKLLEFFAALSPCLVGIEACPSAHYWGRELQTLGHKVRLIPPSYVKAYLKRNKNDANDAAAICEAVTRPSMRFVPIKSEQQQSGLMLHRSRQLLVRQRTMLSNAIRGHLAELGVVSAKGRNGMAELLGIITNERSNCIPATARSVSRFLPGNTQRSLQRSAPSRSISMPGTARVKPAGARGDPWHWPDHCHSSGRGSGGLEGILVRTQSGGLDWAGSQAAFDRRQGTARQHH